MPHPPVNPPLNLRLAPEIMLIGDSLMSRFRWTLTQEIDRLETLVGEHPELQQALAANGWTVRMLAWGHVLHGLADLAGFDDEKGRD